MSAHQNGGGAEAQLASARNQMDRLSGGWERLREAVAKGLPLKLAIRGFQRSLEAAERAGTEAPLVAIDELILSATERAELAQLRKTVPELGRQLTEATRGLEAQRTRNAELQELLEAERVAGVGKPEKTLAAKPARVCRSIPPAAVTGDPVEDWRADIGKLFLDKGFRVNAPRPEITAEELEAGRAPKVGRELIYRPPGLLVPTDKIMVAFGLKDHFVLRPEEQSRIGFSPADEGYWFWGEVAESASHRGGSFEKFNREAPPGWVIMSLEEYFFARAVTETFCGVTLDVDEPVCLRTTYATKNGAREVLYIQSHVGKEGVELIVRSISPNAVIPNFRVRYRQIVSPARLPE